jgi:type II secretory pathway pseudopilin PulG
MKAAMNKHDAWARRRRGFTLTEMAIVFGVIGMVMSGIWVAADHARETSRTSRAVNQITSILSGYRTLYKQSPVDTGNPSGPQSFVDITCVGVNAGYFPSEMLLNVTCATGTGSTYPASPWGSAADSHNVEVSGIQDWNAIAITYWNLPQVACINLVNAIQTMPGIVFANVDGVTKGTGTIASYTPWSSTAATTNCSKTDGTNGVQFAFTAN